ncbi:hypothetical protein FKM82_024068 [Ascaphus truei]
MSARSQVIDTLGPNPRLSRKKGVSQVCQVAWVSSGHMRFANQKAFCPVLQTAGKKIFTRRGLGAHVKDRLDHPITVSAGLSPVCSRYDS